MSVSSDYAATKAGLISLARTLSGDHLSRGIRVYVVCPGLSATPLHEKIDMREAEIAGFVAQIRVGQRDLAHEITAAVGRVR